MKDHVALINEFGQYRLVVNGINGVVKTRVFLQMGDVPKTSGREVIYHKNFVAAINVRV
jgi:hypothetical protein